MNQLIFALTNARKISKIQRWNSNLSRNSDRVIETGKSGNLLMCLCRAARKKRNVWPKKGITTMCSKQSSFSPFFTFLAQKKQNHDKGKSKDFGQ